MRTRKRLKGLELRLFYIENPLKYKINEEYRYIWWRDKTKPERTLTILNYKIEPATEYHYGGLFKMPGQRVVRGCYRRHYSVLFNDNQGCIWTRELTESELEKDRSIFKVKPKKKKKK